MHPAYMVLAEGVDITAMIMGRLISLSVNDKPGIDADSFDLTLDDTDDLIEPPRTGAKIKIFMGYMETGLTYMGEFVCDEPQVSVVPRTLTISGKSANVRDGLKAPKTRAFDDKPDLKKIYGKIASDHGLELKIDSGIGGKTLEYLAQTDESDLHLATRIAERFGAIAKIADGKLIVTKRGSGQSASGQAMPARIITLTDIKKASGKLKDRGRFGSVKARWHDQPKAKKPEVEEKHGEGPAFTLRQTFATEAEAKDACKAKLAELQRRQADCSIEIMGDATLGAEAKITLLGVSRKLDGGYIVKSAKHTMRGSKPGFSTALELEPPDQPKGGKTTA